MKSFIRRLISSKITINHPFDLSRKILKNFPKSCFSSDIINLSNPKKFEYDFSKIHDILNECGLEPKYEGTEKIRVKFCPLCPKPHNNDSTNLNTLVVVKKGFYQCFRCGNRGNFAFMHKILRKKFDLEESQNSERESSNELSDNESFTKKTTKEKNLSDLSFKSVENLNLQNEPIYKEKAINENKTIIQENLFSNIKNQSGRHDSYKISISNTFLLDEMYKRIILTENEKCELIMNYIINERKLSKETIAFYKVGVSFEKFKNNNFEYINLPCVSFPMFYPCDNSIYLNIDRKLVDNVVYDFFQCDRFYLARTKVRAIGREFKQFQKLEPTGAVIWGLFGLNTVPADAKEIILTEGEFDAMAAWQETKIPAISLPNGATSLPVQLLPYLQKFEKIYLWMDADQPGKIAAENFSKKIGEHKTVIVNSRKFDPKGPKDANECLVEGKSLIDYLEQAKPLSGDNIIRLSDLKSDVLQFLSQYESYSGYKSLSFDFFNKKIKGLRMGEFDVLTGETGSGKTTFLTQLSLDFLMQGVPVLWGSFEIKNNKLASLFLMQYARNNLRQADLKEIEYYIENFEKFPLYLLKFHGSSGIDEIINTMQYAVYHHDIQFIILDNLQFMIGTQVKSINKFDFQDEIIQKLRKFATDYNVHITLVIHPRKSDESLKISSIFGSAKASQESDNVFIMQSYKGLRVIEVAKNRFDGNTGKVVVGFDSQSCRFFELTENEFNDFIQNKKNLKNISDERIAKFGKIEPELDVLFNSDQGNEKNPKKEIKKDEGIKFYQPNPANTTSPNLNNDQKAVDQEIPKLDINNNYNVEVNQIKNIEPESVKEVSEDESKSLRSEYKELNNILIDEPVDEQEITKITNKFEEVPFNLMENSKADFIIDNEDPLNYIKKQDPTDNIREIINNEETSPSSDQTNHSELKKILENVNTQIQNENKIEENKNEKEVDLSDLKEDFGNIQDMNKKIFPKSKTVMNLHTDDTQSKTAQLSYIYKIGKNDNNSNSNSNKSQNQIKFYDNKNQFTKRNPLDQLNENQNKKNQNWTRDDFF